MGNPLDSAAFVKLLDTRLREVSEAKYKDLPTMIPKLYRMVDSDSAWEEFYSVGAVPDIGEFTGRLNYHPVHPGYHTRIEPKEYAGGLQSERKLFDDKKYGVLDGKAEGLMESAQRVREKKGALPLTQAFSTAFHYQSSEEGVSLCSSSHTTKSGTSTSSGFDNSGTDAMNKTSIAATRLAMRLFRNDISERIDVGDDLAIVCPEAIADTAYTAVGTPAGLDTAALDKNMLHGRYEVIPYRRLDDSDTNNWFMVWKSQMKKDLVFIDRIKAMLENTVDFETKMMKHSVYMRIACGFLDWRWIFGHVVS